MIRVVRPGSRFFAHLGSWIQGSKRHQIRNTAQCKPKLVHAVNAAGSDINFLADSRFRFQKFILIGVILAKMLKDNYIVKKLIDTGHPRQKAEREIYFKKLKNSINAVQKPSLSMQ
jgi:hypothetical protein